MTEDKVAPVSGSIMVVGGGISGLTTALEARRRKIDENGLSVAGRGGERLVAEGPPGNARRLLHARSPKRRNDEDDNGDREAGDADGRTEHPEESPRPRRPGDPAEVDASDDRDGGVPEGGGARSEEIAREVERHAEEHEPEELPHPDHPVARARQAGDAARDRAENEERNAHSPREREEHEKPEQRIPHLADVGEKAEHGGADARRRDEAHREPHADGARVSLFEWTTIQTYSLEGNDLRPVYDSPNLRSDQRLGSQSETLTVYFTTEDGAQETYSPDSITEFQQFTPGSTWTLNMNLAGGVVSVEP